MYDVILEMGITGIVVGNSFDRYRRKLVIVFYERFLFDDLIVVGNGRIIAKYLIKESSKWENLPVRGLMTRSGVKLSALFCNNRSMPLKTDKMITNAEVPIATPTTLMTEMILMAFCFFLENR